MEYSIYFRFLLALIFVVGLIGLIAWGVRRVGVMRGTIRPKAGARRIEVVEIAPIDAKRRLLLVRRDGTEHLILLSTTGELLIEGGITDGPPHSASTAIGE
jgi:flagellar protein FliO/FliZ